MYRLALSLKMEPERVRRLPPKDFFGFVALSEVDGPWWVKADFYAAQTCQVVAASLAGHKSRVGDWLFRWDAEPAPEMSFDDAFDILKAAFKS